MSFLLSVHVVEGKELPACDSNGKADPYCIIDLGKQHKKTKVCKKTLTPKWNENFEFMVDDSIEDFEIHIFDYDRWKTDDYIGDAAISLSTFHKNPSAVIDNWFPIVHKKTQKTSGQVHVKVTKTKATIEVGRKSTSTSSKGSSKPLVDPKSIGLSSSSNNTPIEPNPPIIELVKSEDTERLTDFLRDAVVADVNKPDSTGYTALHLACMIKDVNKQEEMLSALLNYEGINVKAVIPSDNNTPLHYFCQYFRSPDCTSLFELFVKKGADVNAKNQNGETPLFKAIFNNAIRLLLVEQLLSAGCQVNIYNIPNGEGVLHYAVRLKRQDLVSILLEGGADISAKENKTNMNPLEIALSLSNKIDPAMTAQLQDAKDLVDWLEKEGFSEYTKSFFRAKIVKSKLSRLEDSTLSQAGVTDASVRAKIIQAGKSVPSTTAVKIEAQKKIEEENGEMSKIIEELDKITPNKADHIVHSDLEYIKKLGSGASGDVYRGLYKGKQPVAIKVLKEMMAEREAKEFLKETQILCTLRSPYIVHFFGISCSPKPCMVMELCSRGSLFHVMTDAEVKFGWEQFFHCAVETVSGIDVLHNWTPQIMHRDLKSLNYLVTSDWKIKVCDFGLSRFDVAENMQTMCKMRGTMAFCAPEVYEGQRFTPKSDIYSLGIVLWEMLVRTIKGKYEQPYSEYPHLVFDFQIIIQAAQKDLRPTIPKTAPSSLQELIRKCFSKKADDRPNSSELLESITNIKTEWEAAKGEWDKAIINPS